MSIYRVGDKLGLENAHLFINSETNIASWAIGDDPAIPLAGSSAPASVVSSEIWVNGAYTGTDSDGTLEKPFKTFSAAIASITSDCAIHLAPGVYTEAASVTMPSHAAVIYGNQATLEITGNFFVYIGSQISNLGLSVSGILSSCSCYWEHCYITAGSITSLGEMRLNFCEVSGDITINADKGLDANASEITGRIIAGGASCRLLNCVVICNSASPAIVSTAGYLICVGVLVQNAGAGGDITCDNGASTVPNIFSSVTCATGGIACGSAATIINSPVRVASGATVSGTAIQPLKMYMALGSDATGDLYCRGADGLLTRIPIGDTTGKVLAVNETKTGYVFITPPSGLPEIGSAGQVLAVNSEATGYEFITLSGGSVTINAQVDSYTLVLGDKGKLITMSKASSTVLTIPLNASVEYPTGAWVDIANTGAGACAITASSGVTLNTVDGGVVTIYQNQMIRIVKTGTDAWIIDPPNDTVATSETTATSTYTADYATWKIHRLKTTAATECALTVQNIPLGKSLVIRVDNTAAGSVSFGGTVYIQTTDATVRFLSFTNVTGTIEIVL